MKRIELPYKAGSGQVPNPTPNPPNSGAMQAGVPVEFFWHTPTLLNGFNPNGSKNGNFFVVAPSDNNTSFKGEFMGNAKGGSGPSSFHWNFTGDFLLKPDTDYSVVVTADADCAGLNGKLNPGQKDK